MKLIEAKDKDVDFIAKVCRDAQVLYEHILLVHNKAHWAHSFYESSGFELIARDGKEAITYLSEIKDYYIINTYMMKYCLVENS